MQSTNKISVRKNRFKSNTSYIDECINCIQYKKNFKSINIPEYQFTNFLKSNTSSKIIEIKKICLSLEHKENILNEEFVIDELDFMNEYIRKRFYAIIESFLKIKLKKSDIFNIRKFKNLANPNYQLYFYKTNSDVWNLYLVDIFHLAIPAKNDGKYIYKEKYNKNKNNKICLSEIIKNK